MDANSFKKFGWLAFIVLTIITSIYIIAMRVFNLDSNNLSTLTNLLVATSTFLATFVAIYVINGWKAQNDKITENLFTWKAIESFDSLDTEFSNFALSIIRLKSKFEDFKRLSDAEVDKLEKDTFNLINDMEVIRYKLSYFRETLRKYAVYTDNEVWYEIQKKRIGELWFKLDLNKIKDKRSISVIIDEASSLLLLLKPDFNYMEEDIVNFLISKLKANKKI